MSPHLSPTTSHIAPHDQPAQNAPGLESSTASIESQNGTADHSVPAGTTASPPSGTTVSPPPGPVSRQSEIKRPAAVKKPTMTSRLSGFFGRKGDDSSRESSHSNMAAKMKDMTLTEGVAADAPVSTETANGTTKPPPPVRTPSRQPSQVNGSKRPVDDNPVSRRFWMTEDGLHEHHLKVAKRQQKLKDMLRGLLEKKKEVVEETQLTLTADWVAQKRTEAKASTETKGGPSSTQTLVEKYGKCQEIVGHGAFGIVRVAHKTDSKDPRREQLFAVKEFRQRPGESAKKYQKRLTSEFCISSSMQHPNVIHTLDLLQDDKGDYCEVMEYCAGGDLYTLILAAGTLEVFEADCYFKQLMRGVEYMHEMGVAHRDLKPENLLLTSHGALKITDFGNGECFRMAWEKEAHMTAGLCGSAPYIAPEEYIDREFDPRSVDVWACGVIYMAMRTGRHLWRVAQKGEDEFYTRYLEDRKEEAGFRPIEILRRVSDCLKTPLYRTYQVPY